MQYCNHKLFQAQLRFLIDIYTNAFNYFCLFAVVNFVFTIATDDFFMHCYNRQLLYALLQVTTLVRSTAIEDNIFYALLQNLFQQFCNSTDAVNPSSVLHFIITILTFVSTTTNDKFCLYYCNLQLFHALLQLTTFECTIAIKEYFILEKHQTIVKI